MVKDEPKQTKFCGPNTPKLEFASVPPEFPLSEFAKARAMGPGAIFGGYAAFLAATGWYGAASHDYAPRSMHSLYAGLGGGLVMAVCAKFSAVSPPPQKGAPGYKSWMIGVHLGLVFTALFTAVFAVNAARSMNVAEKRAQHKLFLVMFAGSATSLGLCYKAKPKKKDA